MHFLAFFLESSRIGLSNLLKNWQPATNDFQKILRHGLFLTSPFSFYSNQTINPVAYKYGLRICAFNNSQVKNPFTEDWNQRTERPEHSDNDSNDNFDDVDVSEEYWNISMTFLGDNSVIVEPHNMFHTLCNTFPSLQNSSLMPQGQNL